MGSVSRLDYLLKALEISGKEISKALDIDETTVSKWRNNQRKLTYKSKYTGRIAEVLLSSEAEQKRHIAADILKRCWNDLNLQSRQQQIDALCLWLTEMPNDAAAAGGQRQAYSPKNGYNTSVSVFIGEDGIDEAINYFMNYLLKIPQRGTLYVIDFSGISWTNGDESTDPQVRINASIDLFQAFMENGHKFVIVDCNTDINQPYRAIFRWMRLYLMEGVEVWTHPPIGQEKNYYTSFVMRNEIALNCVASEDFSNERHCMLFKNKESVNSLANRAESILQRSKKLIETVENERFMEFVWVMNNCFKPGQAVYMLNPSLTLQGIDADILRNILFENDIDREKIEKIIIIRNKIAHTQQLCHYTSIIDLDVLERFSSAEVITDRELSAICQKRVVIPSGLWIEALQSLKDRCQKNFLTALVSFGYLGITPADLSIFAQDDTFVGVWDMKKYKKSMYCIHIDVTSGFYRYIEDIWNMIPGVCKDLDWRNKQLDRLMENR
jgi:transcriptional regulator with XRE-family HTH domain